ncbi:MAG TPA: molybdopterin-dependent oxidoreductase [Firmicutes bacterium]|nr:molybdopterin-dependent oxidoreductase [Bacillota bacterium]
MGKKGSFSSPFTLHKFKLRIKARGESRGALLMQYHNLHRLFKCIVNYVLLLVLLASIPCCCGCRPIEETTAGTLAIEGNAVKGRICFALDELKAMEEGFIESDYFALNSYGTSQYIHFCGIAMGYLLQEEVALKEHASKVTFTADDGYTVEYMLEDVLREDYIDEQNPDVRHKMILAWEEDGREYDPKKGNPFRLVVGQREPGDVNKPYWVCYVKTIRID